MFRVIDFMTQNPVTVAPDEKISAVIDLMKYNKIHRTPVVDSNDELVGLITEGMIASSNSATSLSIYELNYLLSKTNVRTVMIKHPISVNENALMEEAAEKLLKHDIGCLPVVNDQNKVTGILTQNDIFKAFLDMLAWKKSGSRIVLGVPEGVGILEKVMGLFASENVSINSLSVYDLNETDAQILIKTKGVVDPKRINEIFEPAGFKVLSIEEL
ncbi:CBS and ACT domain-containing protein [Allobaculum stercoricanis]|uniref:CBS and ACT domain-containing protein n=1 Tax=Allobaculum stercoricanis TaxID=174709 RepID=UPI000381CF2F|nr:CBS and ACT domain-containing protein [Allobaculum stercoricanis]